MLPDEAAHSAPGVAGVLAGLPDSCTASSLHVSLFQQVEGPRRQSLDSITWVPTSEVGFQHLKGKSVTSRFISSREATKSFHLDSHLLTLPVSRQGLIYRNGALFTVTNSPAEAANGARLGVQASASVSIGRIVTLSVGGLSRELCFKCNASW